MRCRTLLSRTKNGGVSNKEPNQAKGCTLVACGPLCVQGLGMPVKELQLQAGRLRYRLLAGFGPEEGWVRSSERFEVFLRTSRRSLQVSISLKGRALAQRVCLPSRETLEDACPSSPRAFWTHSLARLRAQRSKCLYASLHRFPA